jgi:hypothetical protein
VDAVRVVVVGPAGVELVDFRRIGFQHEGRRGRQIFPRILQSCCRGVTSE